MRVAHVISEFSVHEAMGRTIAETAARLPGSHHLVTTRAHDGRGRFASVHEIGGSLTTFAFRRGEHLAHALDIVGADVVHLHGGALTPLWAMAPALRDRRAVHTVYGWPRLPGPGALRHASFKELRTSNVLRARVAMSTALRPAVARAALRRSAAVAVLTPDPDARARMDGCGAPVFALPSGAQVDGRRATFHAERPTVVFAGRAETVRGIDTLLDAFPAVLARVPTARLRLLLIPTAELPAVLTRVARAGLGEAVDVVIEPVEDLAAELAAAQVGAWPFKFDYTTSPPAMAVAEAMAVGLPVVSTPVTCVRSIAHDRNASLVPVGDAARLADAIAVLLTNGVRWEQQAAAGLHTVEHDATWDAAAAATARAYALAGCRR